MLDLDTWARWGLGIAAVMAGGIASSAAWDLLKHGYKRSFASVREMRQARRIRDQEILALAAQRPEVGLAQMIFAAGYMAVMVGFWVLCLTVGAIAMHHNANSLLIQSAAWLLLFGGSFGGASFVRELVWLMKLQRAIERSAPKAAD